MRTELRTTDPGDWRWPLRHRTALALVWGWLEDRTKGSVWNLVASTPVDSVLPTINIISPAAIQRQTPSSHFHPPTSNYSWVAWDQSVVCTQKQLVVERGLASPNPPPQAKLLSTTSSQKDSAPVRLEGKTCLLQWHDTAKASQLPTQFPPLLPYTHTPAHPLQWRQMFTKTISFIPQ